MSNFTISSAESLSRLLLTNPSVGGISIFQGLKPILNQLSKDICCDKRDALLKQYKDEFNKSIRGMTQGVASQMKTILKVDEIRYYIKNSKGELELKKI